MQSSRFSSKALVRQPDGFEAPNSLIDVREAGI